MNKYMKIVIACCLLLVISIGVIIMVPVENYADSDPQGISSVHKLIRPCDIKVGDVPDDFTLLNPKEVDAYEIRANVSSEKGTPIYDNNGNVIVPGAIISTVREYRFEAPEGTYTICVYGYPKKESDDVRYVIREIKFEERENRRYSSNAADFPLSDVVVGDPFEKILLFNPIRVSTDEAEKDIIQYKMFVESGEYVYTLERETQTAEFYITNIEFIEAT